MTDPKKRSLTNPKQVTLLDRLRKAVQDSNEDFDMSWADVLGSLKELEFELMGEYLGLVDEDEN